MAYSVDFQNAVHNIFQHFPTKLKIQVVKEKFSFGLVHYTYTTTTLP